MQRFGEEAPGKASRYKKEFEVNIVYIILGIPALIILFALFLKLGLYLDRKRLTSYNFPEGWEDILEKNFPQFSNLEESQKSFLRDFIRIILGHKRFEGVSEIEIDNFVRVKFAASMYFSGHKHVKRFLPGFKMIYIKRQVDPAITLGPCFDESDWNDPEVILNKLNLYYKS